MTITSAYYANGFPGYLYGQANSLYVPATSGLACLERVSVTLTYENNLSVSAGGPYSVNEGSSVTVTATGTNISSYAWDTDGNGTFESGGQSVSIAGPDGPTSRTITVRGTSPQGTTATSSTTFTVNNLNPTITAITVPGSAIRSTNVNMTAGASDPAGGNDPLTYSWNFGDGTTSSGTSVNKVYGSVGTYTVSLTVTDGDGGSATTTRTITITGPVAANDAYSVNEDNTLTVAASGVLGNDSGSGLTAVLQTNPANGSLTFNANGSFTFVPNSNFNGTTSFTYLARDSVSNNSNVATVTITVNAVNDAPTSNNVSVSTNEDTAVTVSFSASDVDGNALTYVVATNPANGSLSGSGASRTFTPNGNFFGTTTFTYYVTDGSANSNTSTVTITVNSVNDAPTANSQSVSVNEDGSVNITLTGSDIEGQALTYNVLTNPANGTLSGSGATRTFVPNSNFNGTTSFTFNVSDGSASSNTATVTITVNAVNDAPVSNNVSVTTNEDTAVTVSFSASDVDGNALTYVVATNPANGSLSGSGASRTYTPNGNFNGTDSFTYYVTDGSANSNTATVTITVNSVNDAPTANNVSVSTNEDNAVTVTFSGSDIEGSPLTYNVLTNPANGTLSGTGNARTFTPNGNFNGTTTFTYNVSDGSANSNTATVTITVNAVNDAPTTSNGTLTVNEDAAATNLTLSASDVDGNALTYIIVTPPTKGTLGGSGAARTYTPSLNQNGTDTFTFKVNDGTVDSNTSTWTITINPINDAPVATGGSLTVNEDAAATNLTLVASDPDGNALTYTIVTNPTKGVLGGSGNARTYTPNLNATGADSFTFLVNDGTVNSNTATFSITINPINDAPVGNADSGTTNEDTALNVAAPGVLSNDTDVEGQALTAVLVTGPTKGTLTLNANGSYTYTPGTNQNGTDTFIYKARDASSADSGNTTVTITINPVNDAPVGVADSASTNEDTVLTVAAPGVLGNDTDVEGQTLTAVLVTNPTRGTLALSANGSYTYTPTANLFGTDTFVYKARDASSADSANTTVTITVNPINDVPVATNGSLTINEDAAATALTLSAADVETAPASLTYTILTNPTKGTLAGTGLSRTYTPSANQNGTDTFTFSVSDGTATSNTATFTITINPINDAPVGVADTGTTNEDTALTVAAPGVLSNDTEADGQTITAVLNTSPPSFINFPITSQGDICGMDFDSSGNLWLAEHSQSVIKKFSPAGVLLQSFPVAGSPTGVAFDQAGNLWAANFLGNTVTKHNPTTGAVLQTISGINGPLHISFDASGNFWVAEYFGHTIKKYSPAGALLQTISGNGFNGPRSTITDSAGNIYVVNSLAHNIKKFNSAGTLLATFGSQGSGPGQYNVPNAITIDGAGVLWIGEEANHRVQAINASTGAQIATFGSNGSGNGQFVSMGWDLLIDNTGVMWVPDRGNRRVHRWSLGGGATKGTVVLNANGSYTYTPYANATGTDTFRYLARDASNTDSALTTVTITINPVNDAPTVNDATVNSDEDMAVNFTLTGADVEGQTLTYTVLTQPTKGSVTCTGAGACTFTPTANANGLDSFTFRASDGSANSAPGTITLNIRSLNDTPVANAQTVPASEDNAATFQLSASDNDADPLVYTVLTQPTGGKGSVSCTGRNCTFTPTLNANGSTTFTFKVNDGLVDSAAATVTINIAPVNDAPVSQAASYTVTLGTPRSITLAATDVDADPLTYSIVTAPARGTLTGTGATRTYTANPGYSGPDSFVFRATDGSLTSDATVTLTVIDTNLPNPVVSNTTANAWQNGMVRMTGTISDGICPTAPTVTVSPNTTTVALAGGNGSWSYQSPVLNSGSYNYTVSVTSACSTKTGSATAIFGVDTTGSVINYSSVPQGGVNSGDQNTWPIYTALDEIPVSAILQDTQSGLASAEGAVIEVGNGNNTVVIGTQTFMARSGNPPAGVLATGANLCSHNTRCNANKLKLSTLPAGPTIIRLRATDVAGNATTNNYYLRLFGLRESIVAWRDRIEALSNTNTTTQNTAIAKLNAALVAYDNGQLGGVLLGLEDAWFVLSGSEQTSTLTEATRAARTGSSHYQGLINQARVENPEPSAQDEFDTADSYMTTARAHADVQAPGDAFLAMANAFFWKGEGEEPFLAGDYETSLAVLDRIVDEMDAYATYEPVLPGNGQTATTVTELMGAQEFVAEIVEAGYDTVLSDLEHVRLLLILTNTAEFVKVAENETVWVRNWQWGLTQVVYIFAQRGLFNAESQGYGGPIIAEGYDQLTTARNYRTQFRADEFMQLLIDSRCLVLGIYNLSYDPDEAVPPVCCDDMVAYNSIDPNVPVPLECQ